MKGTIVKCLEEMVTSRFGEARWKDVLVKAGKAATARFSTTEVVSDEDVTRLIEASCAVLRVSPAQAMEAFGEHWSTQYAPKIYSVYFEKARNTREFLLNLDHIHVAMTRTAGAHPPRFTYNWRSDNELVMTYDSPRGLVALMPGLVRGVAKHYHESVNVSLHGNDVTIRFAA